jgi:hypothetical protein
MGICFEHLLFMGAGAGKRRQARKRKPKRKSDREWPIQIPAKRKLFMGMMRSSL